MLRQLRPQVVEVPVDDRPESRVERRRRRPLVLADDRRDLVREREERVRGDPLHDLADLALGGRVGERPERADADRVHLFRHERLHRRGDVVFVRRGLHVATRVGPLLDPDDQRALDDRRRLVRLDGIALLVLGQPRPAAVAASHREECVLEAPRRDHAGARERAVDHCVLRDGGGVQEESCSREQRSCFGVELLGGDLERVEDPRGEVRGRRKGLAQRDVPLTVDDDAVRARAADVDSDHVLHYASAFCSGQRCTRSCRCGSSPAASSASRRVAQPGQQDSIRKNSPDAA